MSLWFKSPMPQKAQIFFLIYTFLIMAMFAMVGISVSWHRFDLAVILFIVNIFVVGFGFMVRKRVLRSMGMIKPNKQQA